MTLSELLRVVGESNYNRLSRLLTPIDDPELLILKGHLLVEEQLDNIIRAVLMEPERLRDVRLSFQQKFRLARAINGYDPNDREDPDLLGGIDDLNLLRNSLAHRLDDDDFHERIEKFIIGYCGEDYNEQPQGKNTATALKHIFSCMCSGAEAVADYWRDRIQRGLQLPNSSPDEETFDR